MHESSAGAAVLAMVGALFVQLHPAAATGAAFGCFFFLATSSLLKPRQRLYLLVFSWGLGYSAGVFWSSDRTSQEPMLVAAACSALVAVIFTAFYHIIQKDGDVPPWLKSLFDMVTNIKSKG